MVRRGESPHVCLRPSTLPSPRRGEDSKTINMQPSSNDPLPLVGEG